MNRVTLIIVAVVTVFVGSLIGWFLTSYERYEKEVDIGYSGEAATNQFYAAELFLKKYNMEIESLPSILELKEMPDTSDVLFIPTKRYDISTDRVAELMDWVRKGGHLIVLARYESKNDTERKDELFETLGVTSEHEFDIAPIVDLFFGESEDDEPEAESTLDSNPESKLETDSETGEAKNKDGNTGSDKRNPPLNIQINDKIEDKKVRFIQTKWMKTEGRYETSWEVQGKKGAQLLEFHIDEGWVTLLSGVEFMTNSNLKKEDHAAFLHTLVHINNSDRKLWIIRSDDNPSLLSILYNEQYPVFISFIVFVLFWLWYASRRFGPVAPDPQAVRRSMSEHIVSTGHYQWRSHNRKELLHSVQKALHEQIVQTHPLWVRLSDKERAGKLAKLAGLNEEKVYHAITTTSAERELEFTAIIEVLSKIRKKL